MLLKNWRRSRWPSPIWPARPFPGLVVDEGAAAAVGADLPAEQKIAFDLEALLGEQGGGGMAGGQVELRGHARLGSTLAEEAGVGARAQRQTQPEDRLAGAGLDQHARPGAKARSRRSSGRCGWRSPSSISCTWWIGGGCRARPRSLPTTATRQGGSDPGGRLGGLPGPGQARHGRHSAGNIPLPLRNSIPVPMSREQGSSGKRRRRVET